MRKLLPEFALIHDIFDGSPTEVRLAVRHLQDSLLSRGLVRSLHDGHWEQVLKDRMIDATLDPNLRKLIGNFLKSLRQRMFLSPSCDRVCPKNASEWCQEALASHQENPLDAIIAGTATAESCRSEPVQSLNRSLRSDANFKPAESLQVRHRTDDYIQHLRGVLTHARRICFIDPYLRPDDIYWDFPKIILEMRDRSPQPQIEIHRAQKCNGNDIREEQVWDEKFRGWDEQFSRAGQRVQIFIWGKLHDRHVHSDLVSLLAGGGFHTTNDVNAVTTWSRLSRDDAEALDRRFHENCPKEDRSEHLVCRFYIGAA